MAEHVRSADYDSREHGTAVLTFIPRKKELNEPIEKSSTSSITGRFGQEFDN